MKNYKLTTIIICFIILFHIIVALLNFYYEQNKISKGIQTETANARFYPSEMTASGDLTFWGKYSGIAISKNNAIKLNDYNFKFCDNDYCYYSIPMVMTGKYYQNLGIFGTNLVNNKYYLSLGYANVPLNLSNKVFDIKCVSIDCSLKTIKYYSKDFLLFLANPNESQSFVKVLNKQQN